MANPLLQPQMMLARIEAGPAVYTLFRIMRFASLMSNMWSWIMQSYSRCRLTYPTDKLVAIAGLARQAYLEQGDQYIAGMWKKDLVYQLC
jgi:hypothetical protein